MPPATELSTYPLCAHIKTNGRRCQSPALRGHPLCYFHRKLRRVHRPAVTPEVELATWAPERVQYYKDHGLDPLQCAAGATRLGTLKIIPLEDAESVQLAISSLFAAIAVHEVDPAHARNLLYALQLASSNARGLPRDAGPRTPLLEPQPNDDFAANPNPQTNLSAPHPANPNDETNLPLNS